jgi:hypothetical protein
VFDDVNGGFLKLEDVRKGRAEEIGFMKNRRIWSEVQEEECWRVTGKAPVGVKWVDTKKGEGDIRCRLVARDFKGKGDGDREDLFAATPPLESKRLLVSKAATKGGNYKLLFIDARKAHLNPVCEQDIYICLPKEAGAGPGVIGKLNDWLYGFRPAAQAWEKLYSEKLVGAGFTRGAGLNPYNQSFNFPITPGPAPASFGKQI